MESKRFISRLKAPSQLTKSNTNILRDITTENRKVNLALSASTSSLRSKATNVLLAKKLPSLKTRRSKSFSHFATKPTNLLLSDKSTRPATKSSTISVSTKPPPSRTVNRPTPPTITARIAAKRPLPAPINEKIGTKSTTVAPRPAKISKFDYKARFNALEPKYKQLLEQHQDVQEKLKVSEEENKSFSNKVREQTVMIEEMQTTMKRLVEDNQKLRGKYEQCAAEKRELDVHLRDAIDSIDNLKTNLRDLEEVRRTLHNQVQDLKGTIRVFCRIRPLTADEVDCKPPCNLNCLDDVTLELKRGVIGKQTDARLEFTYDRVFHEACSQTEVFEDLAQLVQSTLDGYNVCVFAYGQTGSGKTYTMMGDEQNAGMIPRSIDLLFNRIRCLEKCGWTYEVQASFLEIYNETIRDLLNPDSIQMHEILHNNGKGAVVTNLRTETVHTAEMLKKLMQKANRNRAVAATNFNLHSSRSHSVTKIAVRGYLGQDEFRGSLHLVDLAGSETAKHSTRMNETKSINKSLSALGNVMLALHNHDPHVPYRNSKLTYLLQSSLGGNSKTLMFVNICPLDECYTETINSLRFAAKVKEVRTGSKRVKVYNKTTCAPTGS